MENPNPYNFMETTELTFEKSGTESVCKIPDYTSGGVIQVQLQGNAVVSASANIPDMPPSVVGIFENPYGNSVIFSLDLPDGLEVTLKTQSTVIAAVWMH